MLKIRTMPKLKQTRKNYSKSPHREELKECVDRWDSYRLIEKGALCQKDYWRERVKGKVPLKTFYNYGHVDISKRTPLGTQVGPSPRNCTAKIIRRARKTKKQVIENETLRVAQDKYYQFLDAMTMPLDAQAYQH